MRSFLKQLFFRVCIPSIVVYAALIWFSFKQEVDKSLPAAKFRLQTSFSPETPLNIVLGSSHALRGVNTEKFVGNWYNMSSPSQSIYEDFLILKHILKDKNIQRCIVTLSYFTNHWNRNKSTMIGEQNRMFHYNHLYNDYKYFAPRLKNYHYLAMQLKKNYKKSYPKIDLKGNILNRKKQKIYTQRAFLESAKKASKRHSRGQNFNVFNHYIDSLISLSKNENIDLIFVTTPYTDEYIGNIQFSSFSEWLREIEKNPYVKVYDFSSYFKGKHEHIFFRNADHLNFIGRDSFSRVLNEVILK